MSWSSFLTSVNVGGVGCDGTCHDRREGRRRAREGRRAGRCLHYNSPHSYTTRRQYLTRSHLGFWVPLWAAGPSAGAAAVQAQLPLPSPSVALRPCSVWGDGVRGKCVLCVVIARQEGKIETKKTRMSEWGFSERSRDGIDGVTLVKAPATHSPPPPRPRQA